MSNKTLLLAASLLLAACFPKRNTPASEIPKLGSLDEVMWNNETIGATQWGMIGESSYSDTQYASMKDAGTRMSLLAERSKKFSRGPVFDKHADSMKTQSEALVAATDKKDAKGASDALSSMKQLCKTCHAETR